MVFFYYGLTLGHLTYELFSLTKLYTGQGFIVMPHERSRDLKIKMPITLSKQVSKTPLLKINGMSCGQDWGDYGGNHFSLYHYPPLLQTSPTYICIFHILGHRFKHDYNFVLISHARVVDDIFNDRK